MRHGLGIGLGRRRSPAAFDVYLDALIGNDANDGRTEATAVQTPAAAAALWSAARPRLGIKRGTTYRATLEKLGVDGLLVAAYGPSGSALPQLLGDDVLSAGGWTKTAGQANVYERAFVPVSGNVYVNIYENDVPLTAATDVANCDATAGSRYMDGAKLYINATGADKDPSTNGKTYDASVREYAIHLDGDNCSVTGVYARRAASHDGSIVLSGSDVIIESCEADDGNKHNILLGSGLVSRCTVAEAYFGGGNSNLIVAFLSTATGKDVTVTDCAISRTGVADNLFSGVYAHANSGSYTTFSVTNCTFTNLGTGVAGDNIATHSVSRNTFTGCYIGVVHTSAETLNVTDNHGSFSTAFANSSMFDLQASNTVVNSSGNTSCFDTTATAQRMFRVHAANVALTSDADELNWVSSGDSFQNAMFYFDNSGGCSLMVSNAKFDPNTTGCTFIDAYDATTLTYVGTGNHIGNGGDATPNQFYKNATSYNLASWQAAGNDNDAVTTGSVVAC